MTNRFEISLKKNQNSSVKLNSNQKTIEVLSKVKGIYFNNKFKATIKFVIEVNSTKQIANVHKITVKSIKLYKENNSSDKLFNITNCYVLDFSSSSSSDSSNHSNKNEEYLYSELKNIIKSSKFAFSKNQLESIEFSLVSSKLSKLKIKGIYN